ncbi:MAG: glutamate racemase, partial [Campylobacterales bacterium]|nr:glutamate racemase [Campylobacterales bacterium]
SGVGGLTVVKSLLENNLFKQIIYFGDNARVPYGTKEPETIVRYSLEALEFFKEKQVDMMIIACNSATAHSLETLKKKANFPVIGVIEPGVLSIDLLNLQKDDSILVIGTKATVNSNLYKEKLEEKGFTNITQIPTTLFVPLVEEGLYSGKILEETMDYYFKDLQEKPKAIILGCTHFPLLEKSINNYFNGTNLIHSGNAIVEYLKNEKMIDSDLKNHKTDLQLFSSDKIDTLEKTAKQWL